MQWDSYMKSSNRLCISASLYPGEDLGFWKLFSVLISGICGLARWLRYLIFFSVFGLKLSLTFLSIFMNFFWKQSNGVKFLDFGRQQNASHIFKTTWNLIMKLNFEILTLQYCHMSRIFFIEKKKKINLHTEKREPKSKANAISIF